MQTHRISVREQLPCSSNRALRPGARCRALVSPKASSTATESTSHRECSSSGVSLDRRQLLGAAAAVTLLSGRPAQAVQGLTAGRIPGVTDEPDAAGYYTYTRPEGKSGGHGIGWSEVPRYSFKVPGGWEETPVSIADLGGTEIDLRFGAKEQGSLQVVVAPVLRFVDVGYNADVRIDQLGPPDRIIAGFGPELFGKPLDEEDVMQQEVKEKDGIKYYEWAVKPHNLVAATARGNRVFILAVRAANSRSWKKYEPQLRVIQESFLVPSIKDV